MRALVVLAAGALMILVQLHGPGGQIIDVNPKLITSMREPLPNNREHFAKGIRCVVVMANGNFITVTETCDDVRSKLTEK